MLRLLLAPLVMVLLAVGLAGCDGTEAPATSTTPTAPPPPTVDGRFPVFQSGVESTTGVTYLRIEVAHTTTQRQQGLMFRQEMGDDEGMLFVYQPGMQGGHWMKNTYIPLDIAYLDSDGRVLEVVHGKPLDETVLRATQPFTYVLEVNDGWFERYGHTQNARVIIPDDLPEPD